MISIKIDNRDAQKMFRNAIAAMKDAQEPLKKARSYQLDQIQEAFKVSGKNIIGQPWTPLRPNTVKEKMRSGFLTNILVRTGKLRDSFKSIELTKSLLKITSVGVPYFSKHQLGEQGGIFKAGVPQRQILGHSPAMIERVMKIFGDFIYNKVKNG